MESTNSYRQFVSKVDDLKNTVSDFNAILISDEPTPFIYNNANFLTKSFLINLCGYLETYLKDALETLLVDINFKLVNQKIPYNLIRWSIEQKPNASAKINALLETKNCREDYLDIKIKKKDLDSFISGNPFRTKELFKMFGISLEKSSEFNNLKELIKTIVEKRNNILHHNDDASDLGNSDIIRYISEIKVYVEIIDKIIIEKMTSPQ